MKNVIKTISNRVARINNYINGEVEFKTFAEYGYEDDGKTIKKIIGGFYLNTYRFDHGIMFGRIGMDESKRLVEEIITALQKDERLHLEVKQGGGWYNEGTLTRKQMTDIANSFYDEILKNKI